jgi:hypothetical protein
LTFATVHVKVCDAVTVPSDTVAVMLYVPALVEVSVPEIRPVAVFTLRPDGRLVAP